MHGGITVAPGHRDERARDDFIPHTNPTPSDQSDTFYGVYHETVCHINRGLRSRLRRAVANFHAFPGRRRRGPDMGVSESYCHFAGDAL